MMRESPNQQLTAADANQAKVVFMRSSFVAGAIGVELFEPMASLNLSASSLAGTKSSMTLPQAKRYSWPTALPQIL